MSHNALQLIYDQRAALRAQARADGDTIGEALAALVIGLEHDDANSSSFRVTAPEGIPGVLGELHYDARTGVNRGDLLRIVEAIRGANPRTPYSNH